MNNAMAWKIKPATPRMIMIHSYHRLFLNSMLECIQKSASGWTMDFA
jgi:hypothetical protein